MKKTKILLTMLIIISMVLPCNVTYAAENTIKSEKEIFMDELSQAIKESDILNEENYTFKVSDDSKTETCFEGTSVEEVVAYLEKLETNKAYTGTTVIKTTLGMEESNLTSKNLMATRGSTINNVSHTWRLTSAYTLSANVHMDSSTHRVTGISSPYFYLHGVTIGIGIEDISYDTSILDMGETAFIKAKYTHISKITTPIGVVEISRSRCERHFSYTYDTVYDAGFNYI